MTTIATTHTYEHIIQHVRARLVSGGAVITGGDAWSISGTVTSRKGPNVLVGLILLCIMILPGVLYFAFAGRNVTEPFLVELGQDPGQPWTVRASGQGRALKVAEQAIIDLPR